MSEITLQASSQGGYAVVDTGLAGQEPRIVHESGTRTDAFARRARGEIVREIENGQVTLDDNALHARHSVDYTPGAEGVGYSSRYGECRDCKATWTEEIGRRP